MWCVRCLCTAWVILPSLLLCCDLRASEADQPDARHWVDQLTSAEFRKREIAERELERLGETARGLLEYVDREGESSEARMRARAVLGRIERNRLLASPEFDWARVKPVEKKSGRIVGRERWTADRSYHVVAPITVGNGAEVAIDSGVVVLIDDGVDFVVEREGVLKVLGAGNNPHGIVSFLAASERTASSGHWGRFVADGNVDLRHVEFRRGTGIVVASREVGMADVGILDAAGDAITFKDNGKGPLSRITIRNPGRAGFVVDDGHPHVDCLSVVGGKIGVRVKADACLSGSAVTLRLATEVGLLSERGITHLTGLTVYECSRGMHFGKASAHGAYGDFVDAVVHNCEGSGLCVESGSYPRFESLRMSGIGGVAINVIDANPTFVDTHIEHVSGDGIHMSGGDSATFDGLQLRAVKGRAVFIDGESSPKLSRVRLDEVGNDGIVVGGMSYPIITDVSHGRVSGRLLRIGAGSTIRAEGTITEAERDMRETEKRLTEVNKEAERRFEEARNRILKTRP